VVAALRAVWEAADRPCGKRLAPFLKELVGALERHGEIALDPPTRARLVRLSAATIDRLLGPLKRQGRRRPLTQSAAADALKAQVPIRTFGEWAGVAPGSVQADLVAHCGESTAGFYLATLVVVEVATAWTELEPVWGVSQQRVGSGVHRVRQRLPVPLRELHTDNGGEFLNTLLQPWCRREGIRCTRGRAYKKNDQAWVEQKNWRAVRRLVGYDRYSTQAAFAQLGRLYALVGAYLNFLQPVRKLVGKERVGAKVTKRYDAAATPYRRLLAAGVLDAAGKDALDRRYRSLNPVRLKQDIDAALELLWALADRGPAAQPSARRAAS
jgi:transposase InsO family protein